VILSFGTDRQLVIIQSTVRKGLLELSADEVRPMLHGYLACKISNQIKISEIVNLVDHSSGEHYRGRCFFSKCHFSVKSNSARQLCHYKGHLMWFHSITTVVRVVLKNNEERIA